MAKERLSETLLLQRKHNRIIEYLEAASDTASMAETFRSTDDAINDWEPWFQHEWVTDFVPPAFTADERRAVVAFNDVWERTSAVVHDDADFDDPRDIRAWQAFTTAARQCLGVLNRRGKLPEDEELSP